MNTPYVLSVLLSLIIWTIGLSFLAPKKQERGIPTLPPDIDPNRFYGKWVAPQIYRYRGAFDFLIQLLNLSPEETEMKINRANLDWKATEIIAYRLMSILFGTVFGFIFLLFFQQPVLGLMMIAIGFVLYVFPNAKLNERIAVRQREIQQQLPDFVDLLVVILEVGTPIQEATLQVANSFQGAIGEEFRNASISAQYLGGNWLRAMQEMSRKLDIEEVIDLVSFITIAMEKGTPLASALREQSARMRFRQQQQYEEKIQKSTTKLMMVMMVCFLLPMLVIVMAPAFVGQDFGL